MVSRLPRGPLKSAPISRMPNAAGGSSRPRASHSKAYLFQADVLCRLAAQQQHQAQQARLAERRRIVRELHDMLPTVQVG